jgi:pentapeptide MXKDX repeat protein
LAINNPNQNDEMNVDALNKDALNKDALNKDALNKDALNKDAINPSAPDAKRNVALPVNVTSKPAKPAD